MVAARSLGVAALAMMVTLGPAAVASTKIACVGASTTSGDGSSAGHHYPDELQRLVAPDGVVENFGVSGTTMLRNVSATYWTTPQFPRALADDPDVVVIWFGGNDAKPENWTTHKGEFLGDYESMIHMFQALPSHPRTYVVLSLMTHDTEGIPKAVLDAEVVPLCRQAAAETGSGIVDVHDDLAGHPEYFPDGIHPNDMGTVAVAKLVYAVITAPADGGVDASADVATAGDAPQEPASVPDDAATPPASDASVAEGDGPDAGRVPAEGGAPAASTTPGGGGGDGSTPTPTGSSRSGGCALVEAPASAGAALVAGLALVVARARRRRR